MRDEIAHEFASSSSSVVVAAAGCGKTELIARAVVAGGGGRQLILTHTHAGVRALRDRLRIRNAPSSSFDIDTIAGFSLRYAISFPQLSGCPVSEPCSDDDWTKVYDAVRQALHRRHIRHIVKTSYAGVYVDEYQDCTKRQHELVLLLATLLPTRVVGDPLQGIFDFRDPLVDWTKDVYPAFTRLPDLVTPYRWQNRNAELGRWLTDVRRLLLAGDPIPLRVGGAVDWVPLPDPQKAQITQIAKCCELLKHSNESIAVIRKWPQQAHATAKILKGRFRSMEPIECEDLLKGCQRLEEAKGVVRARVLIEFAVSCMTKKPQPLDELAKFLQNGEFPGERNLKKHQDLKSAILRVVDEDDVGSIDAALQFVGNMPGVTFHRRELYREMLRVMQNYDASSGLSLRSTAWKTRNRARRLYQITDPRVVSRTLLIKGLEFDHAVVLNADDFDDAQNLYVALTRGTRSLTVMSARPVLQEAAPSFAV